MDNLKKYVGRFLILGIGILAMAAGTQSAQAARAEPGGWMPTGAGAKITLDCNPDADHTNYILNGRAGLRDQGGNDISNAQVASCSRFTVNGKMVEFTSAPREQRVAAGSEFKCNAGEALTALTYERNNDTVTATYTCRALSAATGKSTRASVRSAAHPTSGLDSVDFRDGAQTCTSSEVAVGGNFGSVSSNAELFCATLSSNGHAAEAEAVFHYFHQESQAALGECSVYLSDSAIVARAHRGDENGATAYVCARYFQNGKPLKYVGRAVEQSVENESNTQNFRCSIEANEVMVGRSHSGDENEETTYWCQSFSEPTFNTPIRVQNETRKPESPIKESGALLDCSPAVYVGRYHSGDEQGNSLAFCAELY